MSALTKPLRVRLSPNALVVLEKRYLRKDEHGKAIETPEEMFWRVARAIAEAECQYDPQADVEKLAESFYSLMAGLDFLPNSPTLMNAGLELGQLSACFVLPVGDDMKSIFEAVKNTALIHQSGGGTGYSFSRLRPAGDVVRSTGGIASGPISFMRVFDAATDVIKQGGCLSTETWVCTSHGLRQIGSFLNAPPLQDTPLREQILGRDGYQPAFLSQDNGRAEVYRICTDLGLSLEATYNHLVRVVSEDGRLEWRAAQEIKPGDWLVVKRGGYTGFDAPMPPPPPQYHTATPVHLPERMNPWLAELVGYFIADGCLSTLNNKPGRFVFSVPHNTPDVENWLIGTFKRLGIKVGREQKPDDASSLVLARSITLARWWQKACLDKESSLYAEVPECIRTSSAESVRAFLRGLFEGDGDVSTYGQPHLSSTSLKLIEQVQQILLGLGIVSRFSIVERKGNSYGVNPCYVLRISHHDSVLKFATEIGFRSELKRRRLAERIDKASGLRSDPIPYAGALLSRYYRLPGRGSGPGKGHRSPYSALNRKIARYMRGERLPSRAQLLILAHQIEELRPMLDDELLRDDFIYARVTSVEKKRAYTMDIETLGEEFVANGFLVHNRRRGANMGILRVDHPDILDFITCKAQEGAFSNFNISVALTEKFMRALEEDGEYDLVNPRTGQVVKRLSARQVFDKIAEMAHRNGEPGIIFLDRMNEYNPTPALGEFESTNPCGEQILLPNESCNLGSVNLSNMVRDGKIDWAKLEKVTKEAVHFMDNVITVNKFPLDVIREATLLTRKIGLGVMGFADMLIKLGVPYDSQGAEEIAEELMEAINYWSKEASVELALRRGSFPAFPESIYAEGRLPLPEREKRTPRYGAPHLDWEALQERIRREGIRNATTITIAPTGSISIIAGTSSGIEPIFALAYVRNILDHDRLPEVNPLFEQVARERGFYSEELMRHVAENGTIRDIPEIPPEVRRLFVTAHDVSPEWHIRMQAVFQKHTDNACSKTINMPFEATVEDVRQAYLLAYRLGCKGLTIYRDRSRESQVWTKGTAEKAPQDEGQARHLWRLSRPRPRPAVTRGTTEKIRLGCNRTLYVTVNEDEMGLCEVFLQMGKSGGCTASQSEAIGRLISLALRSGIETEAIIRQLKGIRCPSPSWHNGGPTLSCSDAIAKAMERYLKERSGNFTPEKRAENPSGSEERMFLDICPECPECGAMMEMGEGCAVCRACGYSQCS